MGRVFNWLREWLRSRSVAKRAVAIFTKIILEGLVVGSSLAVLTAVFYMLASADIAQWFDLVSVSMIWALFSGGLFKMVFCFTTADQPDGVFNFGASEED